MTAASPIRRGWCPGALTPMETGDGWLVRVRPRGGAYSLNQLSAIANAAATCGNGSIDLTNRANLQIRGLTPETVARAQALLFDAGVIDSNPAAEAVRNVVVSPFAGLDPAAFDVRPLAAQLETALVLDERLRALPGKFGFALDGGGAFPFDASADIALTVHDRALFVTVGGAPGLGAIVHPQTAVESMISLALVFIQQRRDRPWLRRMRDLVLEHAPTHPPVIPAKAGIHGSTHSTLIDGSPPARGRQRDAVEAGHALLNDSAFVGADSSADGAELVFQLAGLEPVAKHPLVILAKAGIYVSAHSKQTTGSPPAPGRRCETVEAEHALEPAVGLRDAKTNPSASIGYLGSTGKPLALGIGLPYGRIAAEELLTLVTAARASGIAEVRPSPWRSLVFTLEGQPVPLLFDGAQKSSLIVDADDPRLGMDACPGAPACGRGTTSTRADANVIASMLRGFSKPWPSVHVSGCIKGCAKAGPSRLTFVARDGLYDLIRNGTAADTPMQTGIAAAVLNEVYAASMGRCNA